MKKNNKCSKIESAIELLNTWFEHFGSKNKCNKADYHESVDNGDSISIELKEKPDVLSLEFIKLFFSFKDKLVNIDNVDERKGKCIVYISGLEAIAK